MNCWHSPFYRRSISSQLPSLHRRYKTLRPWSRPDPWWPESTRTELWGRCPVMMEENTTRKQISSNKTQTKKRLTFRLESNTMFKWVSEHFLQTHNLDRSDTPHQLLQQSGVTVRKLADALSDKLLLKHGEAIAVSTLQQTAGQGDQGDLTF